MDIPKPHTKKRRRKKKTKRYSLFAIIKIIIIIVLAFIASVVFKDSLIGNNKYILGFRSFITLSDSMSPLIQKGSLIITRRINADSIREGDIITYAVDSDTVTQRVAEIISNNGVITFITKGDAYEGVNSKAVPQDAVIGKFVYSISHAGNAILAIRNPVYMTLCVTGVFTCFIGLDILIRKRRRRKKKRQRTQLPANKTGTRTNNLKRVKGDLNNMELVIPSADIE